MSSVSLHQFLAIYTWFPLAAIFFFMLLIARFYQKFSGERMYFWYFALPIVLFGVVSVRYAGLGELTGDAFAGVIGLGAGVVLMMLSLHMSARMLSRPLEKSTDTIDEDNPNDLR